MFVVIAFFYTSFAVKVSIISKYVSSILSKRAVGCRVQGMSAMGCAYLHKKSIQIERFLLQTAGSKGDRRSSERFNSSDQWAGNQGPVAKATEGRLSGSIVVISGQEIKGQ